MKIDPVVLFIIPFFLFVNCSGNGNGNREQAGEIGTTAQESRNQAEEEDFDQFLDKVNRERIFQMERIIFPITVSATDASQITLAPTEGVIEKKDWELLDLSYDSTFVSRDYDKYTQTVEFVKDTAHVALRGVDNGIYADYYFRLIDGKWYLVTLME
jgi:hypothetical protein